MLSPHALGELRTDHVHRAGHALDLEAVRGASAGDVLGDEVAVAQVGLLPHVPARLPDRTPVVGALGGMRTPPLRSVRLAGMAGTDPADEVTAPTSPLARIQ